MSLYINCHKKGGAFIWKIPKLALWRLFKSGAYSRVALINIFGRGVVLIEIE